MTATGRANEDYPPEVRKAKRQVEKGLESLLGEVDRQRDALSRERERAREARDHVKELEAELGAPFVLRVADRELLRHLASLHAPVVIEAVGTAVVTIGSGPWEEEELDEVLGGVGFTPQLLDEVASDFEVFVVGSSDVVPDELAKFIYPRLERGEGVRLYSQELWLLYLMTGSDPLEWDADLLKRCFGMVHPVLQAFTNEEWDWPGWIDLLGDGEGGSVVLESGPSPLHAFGYRAGVGTYAAGRQERLRSFLGCRTLTDYFDAEHHDRNYRESWGRPSSVARLRRMVSHLHWLLRFQGADARKTEARDHWRQDIEWMRRTLGPMVGAR